MSKIKIKDLKPEQIKQGRTIVRHKFRECLEDGKACRRCPFAYWIDCGILDDVGVKIKFKKKSVILTL